jgi:CxxC motif-containing protein
MQSLQRKINADTAEIKGEEAPKGGLQRKINADTAKIKGEEAPKGGLQRKVNADTPKNGKKIVCSTGNVCGSSAPISFCMTLHHYIMSIA